MTTDAIRQLCDRYKIVTDYDLQLHIVFIDLETAYDRVPHEVLWFTFRVKYPLRPQFERRKHVKYCLTLDVITRFVEH